MRWGLIWLNLIHLLNVTLFLEQNVFNFVQVRLQTHVDQISWVFIFVGFSKFIVKDVLELVFEILPMELYVFNFKVKPLFLVIDLIDNTPVIEWFLNALARWQILHFFDRWFLFRVSLRHSEVEHFAGRSLWSRSQCLSLSHSISTYEAEQLLAKFSHRVFNLSGRIWVHVLDVCVRAFLAHLVQA